MEEKNEKRGRAPFDKKWILLGAGVLVILLAAGLAIYYYGKYTKAAEAFAQIEAEYKQEKEQWQAEKESWGNTQANQEDLSGISADAPAYQSLYPDFYAPQTYQAVDRDKKTIYITFDDGPTERTDEVLDILARENVKATFFVIHHEEEGTEDRLRRIVAEGHTLGMHSYSHKYNQIYSSVEAYLDDMYKIFTEIKEITGMTPSVFRFPGGSINVYNSALAQEMISEMIRRGFVPFDWNLSNGDGVKIAPSVDQLVENVVGSAGKMERGIVLMHDGTSKVNTVQALAPTIEKLRAMGFSFDSLTYRDKAVLYQYKEK